MINYTRLDIRQISRKHDGHSQKLKVASMGTQSQKFKRERKTVSCRERNITCPSFWKLDVSLFNAVFQDALHNFAAEENVASPCKR